MSSAGSRPVSIEVARVGAERVVVWEQTEIVCGEHPTPPDAAAAGCDWPASTTMPVRADWKSGYYEVAMSIKVGEKVRRSYAFFVVRPDGDAPTSSIVMALSTNTWHAYNDFGGPNLYLGGTQVSLQRPMAAGYLHKPPGAGQRVTSLFPPDPFSSSHVGYLRMNHLSPWAGSAGWPNWELPFLRWAESNGYTIDVITNANAVFFSGNTAFWQVRFDDRSETGPAATMIGYKGQFKQDPVFGTERQPELTTIWSDHLLDRPENHMTGVSFARGGYHRIGKKVSRGAGGYTLHRPSHWVFSGTGLVYGDVLGADATVVGYERMPQPQRPTSPARLRHDRLRRGCRVKMNTSHLACSGRVNPTPSLASVMATPYSARLPRRVAAPS